MGTGVSPLRIATANILFVQALKPLGLSGLEPPTSRLSGVRSNRLSYKPSLQQTNSNASPYFFLFLRKEVIQPHLPIRLPCYDFTPVTGSAFDGSLLRWATGFGHFRLPWCDGRCVQDPGTYSPQHSDLRLLAIPASCSRVADYSPNWDGLFEIRS